MSSNSETTKKIRKVLKDIHNDFSVEGIDINIKKPSGLPKFPQALLGLAILKDILDPLSFTVIGIIVTTIFAFAVDAIILVWTIKKIGFAKKYLYRKAAKWIAFGVVGLIPWLSALPETTVLVVLLHNSHTKLVRLVIQNIEAVEQAIKGEWPNIASSKPKKLSRLSQRRIAAQVPSDSHVITPRRTRQEIADRIKELPKAA